MNKPKKRKEVIDEVTQPPSKKLKGSSLSAKSKVNNWEPAHLLSELEQIDHSLSATLIQLFEDDFTIPFLCRYRKELIQNMSPLRLREIKDSIETIRAVETKSASILKSLEKEKLLTDEIARNVKSAKSLEELEHLALLYKPASKGSLFERAQKLGLEPAATSLLYGTDRVDIPRLVNPKCDGLKSQKEVEEGIKNILSHLIAKNELIMNEVRELRTKFGVTASSTQAKTKKTDAKPKGRTDNIHKFENYFKFSCPADRIRPHQILAINRGESLKVLSVKYEVDDRLQQKLKDFAMKTFLAQGSKSQSRTSIFLEAFTDSYKKKISPFIIRQVQSELNKRAEKSAVDVFANNLKNLLLTNPVKGQKILGIDPGFTSGCKLAMISEAGELLETGHVIHPHDKSRLAKAEDVVGNLLKKFECSLIAIGNATACRETESFVSRLIEKKFSNVRYCIVSEQGASIYSCSDLAKKEFPKLDVSFIGAISIARRLLDPLCELVKIEPKHLGVGMYQHDLNEKTLKKTLDEVISECVSFVGVDLNVASLSLLKHVAGLTEKRAEAIVKYREEHGCFKSRAELLKVKSLGPKSFTQCAGFVRINGLSAGIKKFELLDATNVHPESYDIAKALIKEMGLKSDDIGKPKFVAEIQKFSGSSQIEKLASKFKENVERVKVVIEALSQSLLHDYRSDVKIDPVFKAGIVDISTLKSNQIVTGVVMNLTDFGAFVDLGVGRNGLIHSSAMRNAQLKVSDRVECKVLQVEVTKGRIGLEFKSILN